MWVGWKTRGLLSFLYHLCGWVKSPLEQKTNWQDVMAYFAFDDSSSPEKYTHELPVAFPLHCLVGIQQVSEACIQPTAATTMHVHFPHVSLPPRVHCLNDAIFNSEAHVDEEPHSDWGRGLDKISCSSAYKALKE